MNTYIDLLPTELLSITLSYLDKYNDIILYCTFLHEQSINIYLLSEKLFKSTYSMLYEDIKNVIKDDIYLNNNIHNLPNWTVLYAICINSLCDNYCNNNFITVKNLNSIKINNMWNADGNPIMWRSIFNKEYKEIYNKIRVYESFDFENFNKDDHRNKYFTDPYKYGLNWYILYNLLIESTNKYYNGYFIIQLLYKNLMNQDNSVEILKILISNLKIKNYINDCTPIEFLSSLITYGTSFNLKADNLFKFIYSNEIGIDQYDILEFVCVILTQDNFTMFKWILKNGEISWINDSEFDKRYKNIKIQTKYNYKIYDDLLFFYKNKLLEVI